MTISAQSIIQRTSETLYDMTSIKWPVSRQIRYLNDGQRDTVLHRPDAMNTPFVWTLVAGAKQTLPVDGEKVIDVLSNATGSRRAVTKVDRALLDAQVPGWRGLTGSTEILHWMYDPRDPKTIETFPPAAVGAALDSEYARRPTDIADVPAGSLYTAVAGNISIGDLFANALQDYILFRCHSENTQHAQPARAQAHYAAYANALGVELKATIALAASSEPQA